MLNINFCLIKITNFDFLTIHFFNFLNFPSEVSHILFIKSFFVYDFFHFNILI